MKPSRNLARALARTLAALSLGAASAAWAGPFQGGIVTLITPASSGSSFDNAARALADGLAKTWASRSW